MRDFGTIGGMAEHRVRLTDSDAELIVAALHARLAMAGPTRAIRIRRLINRLSDLEPGNPNWRYESATPDTEKGPPRKDGPSPA